MTTHRQTGHAVTGILPGMPEKAAPSPRRLDGYGIGFWTQAVILAIAVGMLFFREMPGFDTLAVSFVSIVLEAFPFMLLGTLVGDFIEA